MNYVEIEALCDKLLSEHDGSDSDIVIFYRRANGIERCPRRLILCGHAFAVEIYDELADILSDGEG